MTLGRAGANWVNHLSNVPNPEESYVLNFVTESLNFI
jgi:hypothetical protein